MQHFVDIEQVELVTCMGQRYSLSHILDVYRGSLNQQVSFSRMTNLYICYACCVEAPGCEKVSLNDLFGEFPLLKSTSFEDERNWTDAVISQESGILA